METEYQVKVTAIERLMLDLSTRFACVLQPTAGQLLSYIPLHILTLDFDHI